MQRQICLCLVLVLLVRSQTIEEPKRNGKTKMIFFLRMKLILFV